LSWSVLNSICQDTEHQLNLNPTPNRHPTKPPRQSTWRRLKRMMVEAVMAEPLVILIKLADRLHNMRTLHSLPRDKQAAVAEETLHVWCSMAGYLGWHTLKAEMEDLCFAVLEEDTYCELRQQLDALWSSPPAPRRRRARDIGRRRQIARAAARHERELEERAEARAAAGGAGAAWRRPLAGLLGLAGGGGGSSSSGGGGGSSAVGVAVAERPLAAAAAGTHWRGHSDDLSDHHSDHHDRDGDSASDEERPPPSRPQQLPPRSSGWLSDDRGPLLPAPLGWEAEGWEPAPSTGGGGSAAAAAPFSFDWTRSPSPAAAASLLTPQQLQLQNLLSTVVPFDAVSFKSASDLSWSAQRGLALLDEAAGQLYTELSVGSFGSGLDVVIQGRLKSLYSVHNKMLRKGCGLEVGRLAACAPRVCLASLSQNKTSSPATIHPPTQPQPHNCQPPSIHPTIHHPTPQQEVYDARALRVIVDDVSAARLGDAIQCCYRLVAAVHKLWRPIANEYDDYISNVRGWKWSLGVLGLR
jgi:hypothetical protein